MVNEGRVRAMTRAAIFEEGKGKKAIPAGGYYRSDYMFIQLLKGFFWGTIAFGLLAGLVVLYGMDSLMAKAATMDPMQIVVMAAVTYVLFIVAYLVICCIRGYRIYQRNEKEIKIYEKMLKRLEKLYE